MTVANPVHESIINLCIDLLMHNMVYEMSNTPSGLPVGVTQAENLSDGG